MEIIWSSKALSDVSRLYEFLASVNKNAARRAKQVLIKTPAILLSNPRIGEQLFEFESQEVRRILVEQYEICYEIKNSTISVLRVWHTRENR